MPRRRFLFVAAACIALGVCLLGRVGHGQNSRYHSVVTVTNGAATDCNGIGGATCVGNCTAFSGGDPQVNDLVVTVETNPIRWWDDGTAPTTASGNNATAGTTLGFHTTRNAQQFKMIATGSNATVQCNAGRP